MTGSIARRDESSRDDRLDFREDATGAAAARPRPEPTTAADTNDARADEERMRFLRKI
jgi:hypothetical protein